MINALRRPALLATLLALASFTLPGYAQTKKELVQKVLQLQQAGIEGMARSLAEQPAAQILQQAGLALQARIAPEKREAVAKNIQADARRYVDETVPLLRDKAIQLAPSTIGAVLEEKFSDDELKQLIAWLESPINRKYQQAGGEMQKALAEKLVAETRSVIEPKVRMLEQNIARRLGVEPGTAASSPIKK